MDGAETRILEAAVDCMEEFGIGGVTIRRIAAKAGVNTAAINYYFRTKEQLMDRVIDLTLQNAFDWSDLKETEDMSPKDQLYAVMCHLSGGAINFPAITRAHFYETMVSGRYDTKAVRALNRFMEMLFFKMKEKGCPMDEEKLRYSLTQVFMSGLISVGIMPNVCREFLGADLTDEKKRAAFLRHLIDREIDE